MAGLLSSSCSEDLFNKLSVPEGEPVTLSLSYKELAPKVVNISRATEDKENKLQNLQVFVFSATSGKLKGYKYLDANELQGATGKIVNLKTTSGSSYIYAIANANSGGTYMIKESPSGLKIPTTKDEAYDEDDVQAGGKSDIIRDDFMKIPFYCNGLDMQYGMLMSGSLNGEDKAYIILNNKGVGSIDGGNNTIHLRRVVAKIIFNTDVYKGDNIIRTFTPTSYDIVNIPHTGNLMESASILDGQDADNNYWVADKYSGVHIENSTSFIAYIPENRQVALRDIKDGKEFWHQREADNKEPDPNKKFINAPLHGTYLRLHGRYTETKHDTQGERVAYVTYYVHLGDFSNYNNNEYNVHRNFQYTYNITVKGVQQIIVEANTKTDSPQPGAEGLVFEINGGKDFDLDAHYEYCVMKFNRKEIQSLVDGAGGYAYSVQEFGKSTGPIIVKKSGAEAADGTSIDDDASSYNGVHLDWIRFSRGGTESGNNIGRGDPVAYPGDKGQKGTLYTLNSLLKKLANDVTDDKAWDANDEQTYTCFLNENYYTDMNWSNFTNIDPRRFFIADKIEQSQDLRSLYAQVKYSVAQRSMQTFYNRANSDLVGGKTVFALEAVSNELEYESHENKLISHRAKDGRALNPYNNIPTTSMDGRYATIQDQSASRLSWKPFYDYIYQACLSRNRDLNGDGIINDDEIRWYTPTLSQYTGMWIGTQALDNKLFEGNMTKLDDGAEPGKRIGARHYYTSSYDKRIYWAEEGMAFGMTDWAQKAGRDADLKYLRCARNIKSYDKNDVAYKDIPINFLQTEFSLDGHVIANLNYVDSRAVQQGKYSSAQLVPHTEIDDGNKPFPLFEIANYERGDERQVKYLLDGTWNCSDYNEVGKGWRVPNQRELSVMYLVGKISDLESCVTKSSDEKPTPTRLFWYYKDKVVLMKHDDGTFKVKLRCIREIGR